MPWFRMRTLQYLSLTSMANHKNVQIKYILCWYVRVGVTVPKNCIKSMKLGLHLRHQTLKSQRPFPWVWWMSMAAVAGCTSCLSSIPKREFNWSRNTSSKHCVICTKIKMVLSAWFFSLWPFFKRSKILERSSIMYTEKNFCPTGCFGYLNISYSLLTIPIWWHFIICLAVVKHCCHVLKLSSLQASSSIGSWLKHFVLE